ncbi:MAG: PAS domain-containing sensor histidine kinase [Bacteroidetes bacterium]|nr:PAS domain-containing sensor histidine kinase [Bacteroidota bacterium]
MDSQEGASTLFFNATEGIVIVDDAGIIRQCNPSAERMFGYGKAELLNKKIEVLIPHRFSKKHDSHRTNYNNNPHSRSMGSGMDLFGITKDGKEFPVEISLSPYVSEDKKYVIAFVIDISIRKQAEEKLKNYSVELERQVKNRTMILEEAIAELEKTKDDLHVALEKERELSELKSRFVSMASHEFRTPLATILSSLSLVTKYGNQNDKEKQDKHILKIKSSINNLTDILNDFLSVSKLEEGKIVNSPEYLDLRSFMLETIGEMQPLAKHNQLINYSHQGEDVALLDKKLLKNILFNLISNAIKFSPENTYIEVNVLVAEQNITISVKDNGIGIPKDEQKYLFQRFFRGNNATHIQGTGLGLNIVAKYAELMNGIISLESFENVGTTITLQIER